MKGCWWWTMIWQDTGMTSMGWVELGIFWGIMVSPCFLHQVFKWRIFSARPMGVYAWSRFLRGVSQVLDTPWHEKQPVRRYGRFQCNRGVFWIQPYSGVQKSSKFWHLRPFFKHHIPGFHVSQEAPGPGTSDPGAPRFQSPCWVCLCLPGCSVLVRTKGMVFPFQTSNSCASLILKVWPMHLIT